jgi:AcrR family transcriptional regulator
MGFLVLPGATGRIWTPDAAPAPRIRMTRPRRSRAGLTARKQPRQQRSRETVRAILEAAARVFEEQGASAATTDAIAARAGVSVGSLYQYFPSKDALLATLSACHLLAARAELEPALARLDAGEPADVALPALAAAVMRAHRERPRLQRLLFADAPIPREQLHALAALHAESCARIARWLAARPEARVDDPARAARIGFDALTALAHGAALDARLGTEPDRERELTKLLLRYFTNAP